MIIYLDFSFNNCLFYRLKPLIFHRLSVQVDHGEESSSNVNEMSGTTSSLYASLLRQQDAHVTRFVLLWRQYCALVRTLNLGVCFVHTQNSRQCLAIKIGHGDPRSPFTFSNSPLNRSKRSY